MRIENPVQNDACTFEETAASTGGERTVLLIEMGGGGGNALHRHTAYDEAFEVIEGRLGVEFGPDEQVLGPKERLFVRRGTPHRFYSVDGEPATFRVTLTPGHAGFERSLRVLYGLARDGLVDKKTGLPKNLKHGAIIGRMGAMAPAGWMRALSPLLAFLAWRGRHDGTEAELLALYAPDVTP